ncbi:tetratricopeptide repeat protein [Amycolatopsis sp. NBC_00355]|uniref:AAA family ATPase n=1 Tax=Amycolatopsis sp. NBC_00355 TaxID=2975957 RepID=UPI002E25C073
MAAPRWKRAAYVGLPLAILVVLVAAGIRFSWFASFADPANGGWPWVEALSWIVGIGAGITSVVVLLVPRRGEIPQAPPPKPRHYSELLNRKHQFDALRKRLSTGPPGVVTVTGEAGIGKSMLVKTVLKTLREETSRPRVCCHTVVPHVRFDIQLLIEDIRRHAGLPAVAEDGESSLEVLTAALASAGQERLIIVIDAAQHLPRSGEDRYLDLQIDEAFDRIDTDRRHGVTVVLLSTELLQSKAGPRSWLKESASIRLSWLPHTEFDILLDRAGLTELRKNRTELRRQFQGNPGCIALMQARNELSDRKRGHEELMAPLGPTVTVPDLLRVTIEELREPHRKVVHALAACGTPVEDKTVVALLTGEVADVNVAAALTELTENRLVTRTSDDLYYLCVDDPAALLPPTGGDRKKLLKRAADELGKLLVAEPTGPDQLRLHLAQLQVLLAAERYEVAYDAIEVMVGFLAKWNCRLMLLDQREQLRGRLGDEIWEMLNDSELGALYSEKGCFPEADKAYGRALAYANKLGQPEVRTQIRANFAAMYWQEGKTDLAFSYYELARSDARAQGETEPLVQALLGLAACHRHWGQYDKAIARANEVLAVAGVEAAQVVKASLLLTRWYTETGDRPEARARLAAAQQAAAGNPRLELLCSDAEADVFLALRQLGPAKARAVETVEQALVLQDPVAVLQARTTLCMACLRTGDLGEAALHIEDAWRYRRLDRALIVLALRAVVTLGTDRDGARRLFGELAEQAESRIKSDLRDFGAHDMLGLAICGVLLDTDRKLDGAINAFDTSRTITQGADTVLLERLEFLVNLLEGHTRTPHRLEPVLEALSGTRTRPPE